MAQATEIASPSVERSHKAERASSLAVPLNPAPPVVAAQAERVYRHRLPVRIGHWLNVVCLFILIGSGLQIFNAHPALYWGDRSDRDRPLLSIRPVRADNGDVRGVTTILGREFDTTGVLGYSDGVGRAFPAWATIPSARWLAMGRQWHLFFAWLFVINGVIFAAYGIVSRHFKRDLLPTGQDLKKIPQAVKDHIVLRHPNGEKATRYNVLQKLAYMSVIFGLAPLIVLTGLTMSPTIDTAFPWLLTMFGGRQAARTIHFIACVSFVGFIVVHVSQVILTGFFNNIRSMVTGYVAVKHEGVQP
ncbi:cytochrome b/b6 domain-containing protein [Nitrospira moscoviensis]|uniref:Thiosulfate reductase cytochrome B subunit (Membrane anchoring protein) n=1 Tax=Nitrospira moscoviensis TaxID=42253 RepID=A0A0K2GHN7_NITMO|nr:cytochrome b/b6 domain-containing protein [Nitrospira moscoviensis]ALA60379.1 Thiosulfate reductase cytochrome B subunit (Membrane anchoring protein) [Nitrospira moscoviensis]